MLKTIALPVHDYKNIFTFVKINHPLLAINKENHHYMLPDQMNYRRACGTPQRICDQNFSIHYAKVDAYCEVQVYMKTPGQIRNYEKEQILSETTL